MTSKKLLFVINNLEFLISHRLPIAVEALRQGCEVHMAAPDCSSVEEMRNMGFVVHPIPLQRSSLLPTNELKTFLHIAKLIRKVQPDILHAVTIKPVIYGGLLARMLRVPALVCAISGLGYTFLAKGFRASLRRQLAIFAYRLAFGHSNARVIFQNQSDIDLFLKHKTLKKDQVTLIKGSGVDTTLFLPTQEPPESVPVCLVPSRLLVDKGIHEFYQAARALKNKGVSARFVLAGDCDPGNPASLTESEVQRWVDEGTLEWWGFQKDMANVFSQSHIICLPSYREGLSKALIEAAACARPIVTTDAPGCRDVVTHLKNGLLVNVQNSRSLAQALETLIKDKALREKMGKEGRKKALEEFDIQLVVRSTLNLYRELSR